MPGLTHAPIRHIAPVALAGSLLAATLPGATLSADDPSANGPSAPGPSLAEGPARWPRCGPLAGAADADGGIVSPWRVVLDADGAVLEHRMTLRREGRDTTLRAGRRSFALPLEAGRLLIGERDEEGTRLSMMDTRRGCRLWARRLDRLVYPERAEAGAAPLRLAIHDPRTRRYEGSLLIDTETGASKAMIDGECVEGCLPNDGDVTAAALASPGLPRPVPSFSAGGWPKDKTLPFRWRAGAAPPYWAKAPLKSGARDVRRTSRARSPRFEYRSDAANAVAYTGGFPSYCGRTAIACAARRMPTFWGVWLRPHGTDYAWGTLRWCQKNGATSGCFDIRRVLLHELGHIAGLTHPSSAGFTLAARDSVMQGITPAKPRAGSGKHAFGRCDVATLQELYDVPDNKTAISTCNDVVTSLSLVAAKSSVPRGGSVRFTAQLRVDDRSAYRQLRNNPLNGRSMKLKYRRAGSGEAWKTAWMKPTWSAGRYEATIAPAATWEFRAVFPEPSDEGLRYSRSPMVEVKVKS